MLARALVACLLATATAGVGCVDTGARDESTGDNAGEVRVDTSTPLAREQYDANVAFVGGYAPRCMRSAEPSRPRVLLTGFGRFIDIANNATGHIVSTLVGMPYPETQRPAADRVDPPEAQLAVGTATVDVDGIGLVDVCGMVLPVYWDVAAILVAKELEAFEPTFVMMNGVARERQPLWIELGAINAATGLEDGSNVLKPAIAPSDTQGVARLVEAEPTLAPQANLLSWRAVQGAAATAIARHAKELDGDASLGELLEGAVFAGFPRESNSYLCNNVTYTLGWLMTHPRRATKLLRASPVKRGSINEVTVSLAKDFSRTPRVFVHWPSALGHAHRAAGADVLKAMMGAQLTAVARGESPTPGDNAMAAPYLRGGDTF